MKRFFLFFLPVLCLCVLLGGAALADGETLNYISYNRSGQSQGSQLCTNYQLIQNSSSSWYDINTNNGGWYAVKGNVTLSSKTTLRVTGDVHLILCDGATLTTGDGVYIKKGSSLSIYGQSGGTGKLVSKPKSGPGIGGMANTVGGSLYIHGGVIEAAGGTNAAGIGGGNHDSGYEDIVIYGGKVTATGGSSGAGIGKGQQNSPSKCGAIIIYGGEVHASSKKYGAGIGGGEDRDGGFIVIRGGSVYATGGHDGAGIGGGEGGSGGQIMILGGYVEAKGGAQGGGIGGGEYGNSGTIRIAGGTVKAWGAYDKDKGIGAGIGGGKQGQISPSVEITGGNVTAIGGSGCGAGIGSCGDTSVTADHKASQGGPITISGGTVYAEGRHDSAGIGGSEKHGDGGTVTVSGGEVTARGGVASAGIGGAEDGSGGTFTITGGVVRAYGGTPMNTTIFGGAGIGGGGQMGSGGTIRIQGGELEVWAGVKASCLGGGFRGDGANVSITGGSVTTHFLGSDQDSSTGASAIGRGDYEDFSRPGQGTLNLAGNLRVNDAAPWDRENVCRSRVDLHIAVCDHAQYAYTLPRNGQFMFHVKTCVFCGYSVFEEHNYAADGICTICNYDNETIWTVSFEGGEATGEMASRTLTRRDNTTFTLPECGYATPQGYVFRGWRVSKTKTQPSETETPPSGTTTPPPVTETPQPEPETDEPETEILQPGTVIPITAHTTLTAVWGRISTITTNATEDGKIATEPVDHAVAGDVVTVVAEETRNVSMFLVSVEVKDAHGQAVEVEVQDGFTFIMPDSAVTVTPTFAHKHMYELISWNWPNDGTNPTATFYCPWCEEQEEVSAEVTTEVDPNRYVATAAFEGITYTDEHYPVTGWQALQDRIDEGSNYITLEYDVTAGAEDSVLKIDSGSTVTLNMNGHTLNRNLSSPTEDGSVILVEGTLKLLGGGRITGGNTTDAGGGILIADDGHLDLQHVTVSGNHAATRGGGISVDSSSLNLTDATVTGNTSDGSGAGVYLAGSCYLDAAGSVRITGNTRHGAENNLYLAGGNALYLDPKYSLASDARIGITAENPDSPATTSILVEGKALANLYNFSSDQPYFVLADPLNEDGEPVVTLVSRYSTPDFTLPAEVSVLEEAAFEGADMTVVYIPDSCTEIGARAFADCAALAQIRIPAGCTVEDTAFDGCGRVYIFSASGSPAEAFCAAHENCVFVAED